MKSFICNVSTAIDVRAVCAQSGCYFESVGVLRMGAMQQQDEGECALRSDSSECPLCTHRPTPRHAGGSSKRSRFLPDRGYVSGWGVTGVCGPS